MNLKTSAISNQQSAISNQQSAISNPQSPLWPPACVRVKTDATRRRYGYGETEEYGQEEHQEGAGGVARHVVERTLKGATRRAGQGEARDYGKRRVLSRRGQAQKRVHLFSHARRGRKGGHPACRGQTRQRFLGHSKVA